MTLKIKTTVYEDGHRDYELMKRKSIRIFGKTLREWYVPFKEPYTHSAIIYHTDGGSYTSHDWVLEKKHFIYIDKADAVSAKESFEKGDVEYRGYTITPLHGTYNTAFSYIGKRLYYIPSNRDYWYDDNYILRGYFGTLVACKDEIDERISTREMKEMETTIKKTYIE